MFEFLPGLQGDVARYKTVWIVCCGSCLLLTIIGYFDFLLFHSLAELFSIVVAMLLAVIGYAANRFLRSGFVILLACGYFWVGAVDLLHLLAYKGMGTVLDQAPRHGSQLWMVARFIEASVLLLAPSFIGRHLNRRLVFAAIGLVAAAAVAAIFGHVFPLSYAEGSGLTPLKVGGEYLVIVMLAAALWRMSTARAPAGELVRRLVMLAIGLSIVQELMFTLYVSVDDLPSLAGHLLKVVAFTALLVAIVEMAIIQPYDALLRLRSDLEIRVHERTLELERANQAKSSFLADMSHELRTPLNAIIGFSEIISRQEMGPIANGKYIEYARDIHDGARHLLGLVNDLLDIAKIEAGRYQLEIQPCPVGDVLRESTALLREQTAAKQITLEVQPVEGEVLADRRALKQILINLMANAIKFTPDGGRITVGSTSCPSHRALFVEDSGVGMTAEEVQRAFEPFVQIERKGFRSTEGTGLGLAIARSLTTMQDGRLGIASEKGRGTRITVCMPTRRGGARSATCSCASDRELWVA